MSIMLEKEERVAIIVCKRSYMFTCSYRTAWNQWMSEEEKEGFTYDYLVLDYMTNI